MEERAEKKSKRDKGFEGVYGKELNGQLPCIPGR
jgi:hypothetical protein